MNRLVEVENEFLRAFVQKEKRRRYLELLRYDSIKHRSKFLELVGHGLGHDLKLEKRIVLTQLTAWPPFRTALLTFLRQHKSEESIFVTSYEALRGAKHRVDFESCYMPLQVAVEKYFDSPNGGDSYSTLYPWMFSGFNLGVCLVRVYLYE